jgi:hypothetical protein
MSPPLLENFVAAAREFCALAEREGAVTESDLWKVRALLLRLIYNVPAVEAAPQEVDHQGTGPDGEMYARVARRFAGLPFNVYRFVYYPHDLDAVDEPITSTLSDDLPDIYRDLAQGLNNADQGHLNDACFEWSTSYSHWGRHAMSALSAIEVYRMDNYMRAEFS